VYELLGRFLGMTLTAATQRSKHVVWKNFIVLRKQLKIACSGPPVSSISVDSTY
jgi:hypothetical protein